MKLFHGQIIFLVDPAGKEPIEITDEVHSSFSGKWHSLGWDGAEENNGKWNNNNKDQPPFLIDFKKLGSQGPVFLSALPMVAKVIVIPWIREEKALNI